VTIDTGSANSSVVEVRGGGAAATKLSAVGFECIERPAARRAASLLCARAARSPDRRSAGRAASSVCQWCAETLLTHSAVSSRGAE
jgi:hypothetical protein